MTVKLTRCTFDMNDNKTEEYDFIFQDGEVSKLDNQININKVDISFPSEDDTEDSGFSLNLGTEDSITLSFKIFYEDTDRSNGTNSSQVKTFEEIVPFLKRKFFKQTIGEVLFRLQTTTKFETIDAYFSLQSYSLNTAEGIHPKGNLKLKLRYYESEPTV